MRCLFFALIFLAQAVFAKDYPVKIGDTVVLIRHIAGKGKTFVHLHQNEQTALQAAKIVISKEGGSLLTLVHKGTRNIEFMLCGKRYEFDPNRIFTDRGIKKTLSEFGPYTPGAHRQVRRFAQRIQSLLPKGKIVAVHNNASYSLRDYFPGHNLAAEAKEIFWSARNYYRNFYLVTQTRDYKRLKAKGFNGVLQHQQATDDGSLSVVMANKDYINVEAGYGQLMEQVKMLKNA